MSKKYNNISKERKALQKQGLVPEWYNTGAWQTFKKSYAHGAELGVKGRFEVIAKTLSDYLPANIRGEYYNRFFNMMWKGWFSPASPVLANTGTTRGLNVSCSGGVVGDSIQSFYDQLKEQAILTKNGFGCSADFSNVRPRGSAISGGGVAEGVMPVIDDFATMASKVSQGSNRRGATASYLDIEHGDFYEVCDAIMHAPDGLNIGWNIRDSFVERLKAGDLEAHARYTRSLYVKLVTGKGYYFFVDKANRDRPQMYKDLGLFVKASNLCVEIRLYADDGEQGSFDSDEGGHSFTCVLSSMNVFKYDEWKDTTAVEDATVFLDCVVSDFLAKSYGVEGMQRVHRFTRKSRPVGLGVLGFASYLQKHLIPYESLEAYYLNEEISKKLWDDSLKASQMLAQLLGEPLWCKGYGVRNTHRIAYAPTKTTAQLMGGMSESFGPDPAVIWTQSSAVGDVARVNPQFLEILKAKGIYTDEIIDSIIKNVGSCQHLVNELTDQEREAFKTSFEISPYDIIRKAKRRQKYTDQGQSLNLSFSADGSEEIINDIHSIAFMDEEIHSLYYIYSMSGVVVSNDCPACEA